MHRALFIQEILLHIFDHCSCHVGPRHSADLAVLARTCRTFKEPALDVLWEDLHDLSSLVRCLPEVCSSSRRSGKPCYSFSRPLNEADWNILRGYTRRVKYIYGFPTYNGNYPDSSAIRIIFTLAPFADPLFPNLRSLTWQDLTTLPVAHAPFPSLTSLYLDFKSLPIGKPLSMEFLDIVGERCPNMKRFRLRYFPHDLFDPFDGAASRQVLRWTNIEYLDCSRITLSLDAILHLVSVSNLTLLAFTLSADSANSISHSGSILTFSHLADMEIDSASLGSITTFLSHIQLPVLEALQAQFSNLASKWDAEAYWAAVQKACSSMNILNSLILRCTDSDIEDFTGLDEQMRPQLTLNDLPPYKDLASLHTIHIDLAWSVKLTDADLLAFVSRLPSLEELIINDEWGWRTDADGGVTLSGLVQLLRRCPCLAFIRLAIDTQTFTHIPQGMDVWFPPRGFISVDVLDSYIRPEFVPGVASVMALNLRPLGGSTIGGRDLEDAEFDEILWHNVYDEMFNRGFVPGCDWIHS